jgi:co-chaperonin GroES (HSP10)
MTTKKIFEPHKIKNFSALHDHVIVSEMNFEQRLTSYGIILHADNAKSTGIRPRWARVYAIGPDEKTLKVGQWVCVEHGRWTRGVKIEDETGEHTLRRIDTAAVLLVSDEIPSDDTMSDAIAIAQKTR